MLSLALSCSLSVSTIPLGISVCVLATPPFPTVPWRECSVGTLDAVSQERKALETWDRVWRVQRPQIMSDTTHFQAATTFRSRDIEQNAFSL